MSQKPTGQVCLLHPRVATCPHDSPLLQQLLLLCLLLHHPPPPSPAAPASGSDDRFPRTLTHLSSLSFLLSPPLPRAALLLLLRRIRRPLPSHANPVGSHRRELGCTLVQSLAHRLLSRWPRPAASPSSGFPPTSTRVSRSAASRAPRQPQLETLTR